MNFETKYIDELIDMRAEARLNNDWMFCDEIRNYLDTKLVFVFDGVKKQEVYYLTESYFKHQHKDPKTAGMSKRKYVEYQIKRDIAAEKNFDAWLYTIRASSKMNK